MAIGAAVAIAGAGFQLVSGIFGAGAAKKRERAAAKEKQRLQRKLTNLENNRQDITNPYAGVSDLSGLAMDLSSNLTNPFENLSVATKAAEMQVEEAETPLLPNARESFSSLLGDAFQHNRDIEIERAQGFGQAYIEEKHGMPFHEWVKKRKEKNLGGEE